MPSKIFVNYRRDDDPNGAARVRDGLAAKFGKSSIFMDVDNLLAGQRFDQELAKALAACDVLIAIIGPRWMDLLKARAASGERDYVREEIAAALARKIVVIPVLVGREGQMPRLPRGDDLPEDIRDLVLYQKHDVAYERFARDCAELIQAITIVRRTGQAELAGGRPWGLIGAGAAGVLAAGYIGAYALGLPVPWPVGGGADAKRPPVTISTASDPRGVADAKAKAEVEAKRDAALKADDEAFQVAERRGALDGYGQYLGQFPEGRHVALAKERLAHLKKLEDDFARLSAAGSREQLDDFARVNPAFKTRIAAVISERDRVETAARERAAAEAKKKSDAEAARKVEQERQRVAAEQRAKEAAGQRAKEAAEQRAKEAAEQRAKEAAGQRAKEAAEQRAKEAAEQRAKEAAEQRAKEAAEQRAKEAAEQREREAVEAARKRAEEEERRDRVAALTPGSGQSARDCWQQSGRELCGPEMVVVPAGSFMMGSPKTEPGRNDDDDEAQVPVTIARPFAAGKFSVTFDEWDACVADGGCQGYKPKDEGWGRGKRPVINVNWDDAKAYVAWLARKTGKSYRLLSEAEREHVTRAGTTTPFWWGSSITPAQANYDGSAEPYKGGGSNGEHRRRTVPVESFQPNPWGLYNVHANIWEWTEDCWNGSNTGNPANGSARTSGDCSRRVVRGGSWYSNPRDLRSAIRIWLTTVNRGDGVGFRVARSVSR